MCKFYYSKSEKIRAFDISVILNNALDNAIRAAKDVQEFHGQGIGSYIIDMVESDVLFLRAERIEILASITAVEFYQKKRNSITSWKNSE